MVKTIPEIASVLKKSQKLAIFCHTQPDGDTVGSAMALCYALRKMGKTADAYCDEPPTEGMREFLREGEISLEMRGVKYDTLVAVDCGDIFRLGVFSDMFEKHPNTVVLDHHMGKPFGKYCYIADFSSTAEIIFDLLNHLKIDLDRQISTMLYIGLITDTGNFMHANTNANTFAVASDLAKRDIHIAKLSRVFFRDSSFARTKLVGRVISRMRSYYGGLFCLIYVKKSDFDEFGLTEEAAKNIVDYAINIKTALVGISLVEASENVYRVSIRGKEFDIRSIAERFGGGGHKFAAGCQISGFFEDVADKLERFVGERLEEAKII